MKVLETQWWTIAVPPEWWAESEEDTIVIGDRDDVGCIEFSTLQSESGDFSAESVLQIAKDGADQAIDWQSITRGDFAGVYGTSIEEGDALREWYLAHGEMLLYITYSCAEENAGMDDAAVNEILDTLLVVEE